MVNILKKIKKTETFEEETETEYFEIEEDEQILLPSVGNGKDVSEQYAQIMFFYESGISQVTSKLQILNNEFKFCNDRNPIDSIRSRVKSLESIRKKMQKKGLPLTVNSMMKNLRDIAGVRVVCPFISDVYQVANM